MPRQRAKPTNDSTSLLSSVFSFVSREFDSFVSNATGRPPREDEDDEDDEEYEDDEEGVDPPQASSSRADIPVRGTRVRAGKNETTKTRRREYVEADGLDEEHPSSSRARSQSRRRGHGASDSEDARRKRKRIVSSPRKPCAARRNPILLDEDEDELVGSDQSRSPSPKPPSILRHKRSFTMPGALYDRTSSLEPSPEPDDRPRVVRFASEVTTSPSPRKQPETPRSLHHNRDAVGSMSSGRKAAMEMRKRTQSVNIESSSEDDGGMPSSPTKRSPRPRRNSFVRDAIRLRSAERNPDVSLLLPRSPVSGVWSSPPKDKGKEKARAAPETIDLASSDEENFSEEAGPRHADMSVRTRVRGKERELHTARQQERTREDDEERRRDKERIRALEEELRVLREELAKKSASQPFAIPPPPPPPPPPRPPTTSQLQRTLPTSTFAEVRACLRHAGTPVEKPINPAAYGGPAIRKGQPTIVGADMMAAFLSELKTHRLRRIGSSDGDGPAALRSRPAERVREVGEVGNRTEVMIRPREMQDIGNRSEMLPRPSRTLITSAPKYDRRTNVGSSRHEVDAQVGDKRKYTDISYEVPGVSLPSKRRAIASSLRSSDSSRDSISDLSISSSGRPKLPSRSEGINGTSSRPAIAVHTHIPVSDITSNFRVSSSMRAETEVTTPSLSSDNEHENISNESQEGRLPPTPPPELSGDVDTSISMREKDIPVQSSNAEEPITSNVYDADEAEMLHLERYQSEQRQNSPRPFTMNRESPRMADSFMRRQGASRTLLQSPRRPRPPARVRLTSGKSQHDEGVDEEDPLSLSYTSTEVPSYVRNEQQDRSEMIEEHSNVVTSPPIRLPMRPPPGMFKPPKQKNIPPSRLPIRRGTKKSSLSSQSSSNVSSSAPATLRRRDSLDAELRRAEAEFEADITTDDVWRESGTYEELGTRSHKQGFIAFGGGGGPSVTLGEGNVKDLEFLEDHEDGVMQPSRRMGRRV